MRCGRGILVVHYVFVLFLPANSSSRRRSDEERLIVITAVTSPYHRLSDDITARSSLLPHNSDFSPLLISPVTAVLGGHDVELSHARSCLDFNHFLECCVLAEIIFV